MTLERHAGIGRGTLQTLRSTPLDASDAELAAFPSLEMGWDQTIESLAAEEARLALDEEPDAFQALARYLHRDLDNRLADLLAAGGASSAPPKAGSAIQIPDERQPRHDEVCPVISPHDAPPSHGDAGLE